jgi:hypothetical protein
VTGWEAVHDQNGIIIAHEVNLPHQRGSVVRGETGWDWSLHGKIGSEAFGRPVFGWAETLRQAKEAVEFAADKL